MPWFHIRHEVGESVAPEHVIIEAEDLDEAAHAFNRRYDEDPSRAEHIWGGDPRYGYDATMKYSVREHDTYREALKGAFGKERIAAIGKPRVVFEPTDIDVSALEVVLGDEV